jgi:phosphoribosylamine--glycine ligase
MKQQGTPFVGFLYAGLMIDKNNNPKVLEFNVRFGDPETQPIMMRLQSNLDELCLAAIKGQLNQCKVNWNHQACLGVVLAEKGYPNHYEKGSEILGLESISEDSCKVFHAGTAKKEGKIVTNGGRVLCVCALADTIKNAQEAAYKCVDKINWKSKYNRTDIGFKAIKSK